MPLCKPTILPDLFQIALPTPFRVGTVNVYALPGDPLTLIDCGINSAESLSILSGALHEIGHSIEEVGRVIISHHHVDHLGAVQPIVEASAAEVIAHPYTVPYLEMPHAVRERNWTFIDASFRQVGVPEDVMDVILQVDNQLEAMMGTVTVGRAVDEGDTLYIGAREWQVYHMPGHAGGLITLFDPESRVMLSSDHLLMKVSSNPLIEAPEPGQKRPRRLLDYLRHLERIAALNPIIAYTGHGEPVQNVRELVARRLEMHQHRADRILALFDGQPHTLYELTQKMFPKADPTDAYLTLSEVLGHLDMLEVQGRIERDPHDDGLLYWKPV
jgi:glyoxylase-like metal-dependent hydrolase (beta-lactamase superfamily II)